MDSLRDIRFFSELPEGMTDLLAPIASEERYQTGDVIFDEGVASDRFFIIRDGEVEIRKSTDPAAGLYKLIAVLVGGEFFGEMGVFMDQPRTARAVAKTDLSLISIKRDALTALFAKNPEAAFAMMGFISSVLMRRLGDTTRELAAVYETGRRVVAARGTGELSDSVLDGLFCAIEQAGVGVFVLWNEFNMAYEVIGQRGLDIQTGMELTSAQDDAVIRLLVAEPILSFDTAADPRFGSGGIITGRSMVAAPFVLRDGSLAGFVALINKDKPGAFSYNHMVLLQAISGYVSVAIENLRYMQDSVDRARLNQAKSTI